MSVPWHPLYFLDLVLRVCTSMYREYLLARIAGVIILRASVINVGVGSSVFGGLGPPVESGTSSELRMTFSKGNR